MKKLKKITQEAFDKSLHNHFIYLNGGGEEYRMVLKDSDFSWVFLAKADLSFADFENSNLSQALGYSVWGAFYDCVLEGANFTWANLAWLNLSEAKNLKNTILIGAQYDSKSLTDEQRKQVIATKKQHDSYIQKKDGELLKKDIVISKIWTQQSKNMLDIFSELERKYLSEEAIWLVISISLVFFIFTIANLHIALLNQWVSTIISYLLLALVYFIISLLSVRISNSKDKDSPDEKWLFTRIRTYINQYPMVIFSVLITTIMMIAIKSEWASMVQSMQSTYCKWDACSSISKIKDTILWSWTIFAPLIVITISSLWFSVHQYGRAKKLRIEQQNKQAMIHFMQSIIAQDGKWDLAGTSRILPGMIPFLANAVAYRSFSQENYEPQLPIDEIAKIVWFIKK